MNTRPFLISRLKEEWNNLDPVDPLRGLIADAIDALAEAQQEPVAYMDVCEKGQMSDLRFWSEPDNRHQVSLYTFPPASKPWVGLTQEDMYEIGEFKNTHGYVPTGFKRLAAAIEAKLREKNNG